MAVDVRMIIASGVVMVAMSGNGDGSAAQRKRGWQGAAIARGKR